MSRRAWAFVGGAAAAIVIVVLVVVLATGDDSGKKKSSSTTTSSTTTIPTDPPVTTTTSTPSDGFATPEDAIEDYLETKGYEYAGDCAGTDPETDVGKWCSGLASGMEDPDPGDNTRTYFVGPTFSEGAEELTLTQGSDGRWRVTNSEAIPPIG